MKLAALLAPTMLASIGTISVTIASRALQALSRQLDVEPLEPIAARRGRKSRSLGQSRADSDGFV